MQTAVAIIAGKVWGSKEDLLQQTTKFIISIVKQNTMSNIGEEKEIDCVWSSRLVHLLQPQGAEKASTVSTMSARVHNFILFRICWLHSSTGREAVEQWL